MNRKKWVILVLTLIIIASGLFWYINKDKELRQIEADDLTKDEQAYLKEFYKDTSIISSGNLFDIRYDVCYSDKDKYNITSSSIEIVKKYNVDMSKVKGTLLFSNGEKFNLTIGHQNSAMSAKRYMFGSESNAYHCSLDEIAMNFNQSSLDFEEKRLMSLYQVKDLSTYDFNNIVIEFEYDGKKETHQLNYDEKKMDQVFKRFFESYYQGKIKLNEKTINCFTEYYQDYISVLQRKDLDVARTFIDEFNSYYVNEEYYEGSFFGLHSMIFDYFEPGTINGENSAESLVKLKEFLLRNKDFINRTTAVELIKITSVTIDVIRECAKYNDAIDISALNKNWDEFYNGSKATKEGFWTFVNKQLK